MRAAKHLVLMPPNWIGDVIMAQASMRAIAEHFVAHSGTERISICGRGWLRELLPFLSLPAAEYCEQIPAADCAVLFTNNFRSAWMCRKAGVKQIIGYRGQWRRTLLHTPLPQRISQKTGHHRDYFLNIAEQLGIEPSNRQASLSAPERAIADGQKLMLEHGLNPDKTICIAPGAQFGGAKCYPGDGFRLIAEELATHGWQPLILGMAEDSQLGDEILQQIKTPAWNAAGQTTLGAAISLIAAGRLMLCNDSGLMHVAAGLGIATVAPFGATDPKRTAPSGPKVRIIYQPADCSPCLQRECSVEGHPCMANITPNMLLDACLEMLG